ncbi:hypothetical protein [Nitriliruptor alkaliphilus]|uniref:hypothetical protein n=1 Tax=Nitriliruptor alkaliphilus TaxID=427918 RepID=UPI000695F723|nr:hypothetical protein [Nitriliruptor alkaliphilus]
MTAIQAITLEVADLATAEAFYATFLGPDIPVHLRTSQAATSGFRGFTLSLVVPRPADVDRLVDAGIEAGATALASKRFYVDRGLAVDRSFGRKYVQFEAPAGAVRLALYGRRALAKDAGVPPEGTGSHRIAIASGAGPFADPDGFVWEAISDVPTRTRNGVVE